MHRIVRFLLLYVCLLLGGSALADVWPTAQAAPGAALVVAPVAAPDLLIESITLNPANPGVGGKADIIVKVKNVGDAATAASFRLYLYVDPATTPPDQNSPFTTQSAYGLPLPPGGEFIYTRAGHTFTNANPKLYAWVDPPWENRVAEPNENNNLFPATDPGLTPDSYENDNDCTASVKSITTDGVEQQRNFNPDPVTDIDWVQFTGVSGVTYYAQAIPEGDADLTMELHAICDGPPSFGGAAITFTVPNNGVYLLKVFHNQVATYGTDSRYRLKITSDSDCVSYYEVNDTCAASGDLALNSPQTHTFCQRNDVDWLHFPVSAGGHYKISTDSVGANADVRMSWFASCNDPAAASGETLEFTAPSAGLIYLKLANANGELHGAGTEYTVNVQPIGNNGCAEDALEQDDTFDQAKMQGIDSAATTHNTCPAGDEDWSKFSATAGVTYTLETLTVGSAGDTELCLFTADGATVQCDDDQGAGKGSRLRWTASTTGDYFLRVKDHNATVAGPATRYDLQIRTYLCDQDAGEVDNSQNNARPLTVNGAPLARNICPASDEDWFAFTAAVGAHTIETLDNGPEADTILSLYDGAGTLLATNDDHSPGVASQVVHTFAQAGTYYVKAQLYNPTAYGPGTEYAIQARVGTPTPIPTLPPTATPTPEATPTSTPQPSALRTLILVNRTQVAKFSSEAEADQLVAKLQELAQHTAVQGQVIRLDQNNEVSAAYTEWNKAENWTNIDKANAVAAAIRQMVRSQLLAQTSIQYLVLAGDDRALPFRRIYDNTPQSSEKSYTGADIAQPVGAAQRANYFLSDDYYAARDPIAFNGRELFIPDVAVGRLVETPTDMINTINNFLAMPVTTLAGGASHVLITGYDFVQDQSQRDCQDWRSDLGNDLVDCSLISDAWSGDQLRALQLRSTAPFKLQMIAGHANHYTQGVPQGATLQAHEILNSNGDWRGGLVYSPACHAGLNVPPTNSLGAIDLTQAFVGRGANYVANTGFGWGLYNGIGLSERLIQFYTQELLKGSQSSMGTALVKAKQRYYNAGATSAYDEKVLEELTFYGLPMQQLQTGAALSQGEEFPGVQIIKNLPPPAPGLGSVEVGQVTLDFQQAQNLTLNPTANGNYYALNNYTYTAPDEPIQPLHFANFSVVNKTVRGVVIVGGMFATQPSFTPVLAVPDNEYVRLTADRSRLAAWQPATPLTLQRRTTDAYLVTQLGQYNALEQSLRLYQKLDVELYYSTSADQTPPQLTVVDGVYSAVSGEVMVKVGATDASGIREVILAYVQDRRQASGAIQSLRLTFDPQAQKWRGVFPGDDNARFTVQVVDNAGNVTIANNKGAEYQPGRAAGVLLVSKKLYLPIVTR